MKRGIIGGVILAALMAAFVTNAMPEEFDPSQIVTLLPRDAIPAILDPNMTPAREMKSTLSPELMVLGVSFNGESHAYPIPTLSRHEIVNDVVGGVKIAATW